MGSYLSVTAAEQQEMLSAIGLSSVEDLYAAIPDAVKIPCADIPEGLSELAVLSKMQTLAAKNTVFDSIFLGAGAYRHYIPAIVKTVAAKETFLTAYTPYQAELSQGILQAIFEFQTMTCALTGMDAANASVYDGASAAAEAVAMCRERKRNKMLLSEAAHPMTISTVRTYCEGAGTELVLVPTKDGKTDTVELAALLDAETAGVYIQQPNFYGQIEHAKEIADMTHAAGGRLVMGVNPISLGVLESPAACGADIAVGEGQPLGLPLSYGGPYLGFMACTKPLMRRLPGRIAGETTDTEGRRAFVLTLQAREQHIRREKASSNVCSNQALCALTASVYLAAMGPEGMREVASQCLSKAHYAAKEISAIPGFALRYTGDFFHEFVTETPIPCEQVLAQLEKRGILGGLPLGNAILWCVTEMNTKAQIDTLVLALKEVAA